MTITVDEHTCGDVLTWRGHPRSCVLPSTGRPPCKCWLAHGHTGFHECAHGWTWKR